ncbi:hypothetical protein niasHT_036281 [Heterodera trifolii]|uniref:Uncharacterized protein n=1 Tax=Heterodera trifolii TaxID=157864 RepID=A0ABD2I2W7_9BILA
MMSHHATTGSPCPRIGTVVPSQASRCVSASRGARFICSDCSRVDQERAVDSSPANVHQQGVGGAGRGGCTTPPANSGANVWTGMLAGDMIGGRASSWYPWWGVGGKDASTVFENAGLVVLTDAFLYKEAGADQ